MGKEIGLIGDPTQIDNPHVDSRSNGLVYCANRMRGQAILAHVQLTKGERSTLAELAADLLLKRILESEFTSIVGLRSSLSAG